GTEALTTDARVIAATNRDLEEDVAKGTFRRDLYYRLNVFPIRVPPLRDRKEDLPILVEYFAARYGARIGKRFASIERGALDRVLAYPWPGNVRELQNVIERAAILSDGDVLRIDEPLSARGSGLEAAASVTPLPVSLREAERRQIEEALAQSAGRVSGAAGAATRL